MMRLLIIPLLFITLASLAGCYYDKEEELYAGTGGPCITVNTSYQTDIQVILQRNGCLGCHNAASAQGNIVLEGYNNVKSLAASGQLYGAVSHTGNYSPMPKGGARISNCDISKIRAWIDAGTPNN
jgi:hypothetical protein